MIDDELVIPFDPPDSDIVWAHYLETCRYAGVKPVSREQADESRNGRTRSASP